MLPRSKACACGQTIPKEWPLCVDCTRMRDQIQGDEIRFGSNRKARHAKAMFRTMALKPVKARLEAKVKAWNVMDRWEQWQADESRGKAIAESKELQGELLLLARAQRRHRETTRAPQALADWYANGTE